MLVIQDAERDGLIAECGIGIAEAVGDFLQTDLDGGPELIGDRIPRFMAKRGVLGVVQPVGQRLARDAQRLSGCLGVSHVGDGDRFGLLRLGVAPTLCGHLSLPMT